MLQQMLHEDKDDLVRETVVKNLALLLLYVDDVDKFSKVMLKYYKLKIYSTHNLKSKLGNIFLSEKKKYN